MKILSTRTKLVIIAAAIVVIILSTILISLKQENDVLSINLRGHGRLALHIHPNLQIEINSQQYVIQSNIGISNEAMRVIHTHDTTGELHVESPVPHQFYLRDLFTIWEKRFDSSCIFDYCANRTHELRMTVNGQPSDAFGSLPLRDTDNIKIIYSEKV